MREEHRLQRTSARDALSVARFAGIGTVDRPQAFAIGFSE
jgi:hypothetical protein